MNNRMKELEGTWVEKLPSVVLENIQRLIIDDYRRKYKTNMRPVLYDIKQLTYPPVNNYYYVCDGLQIRISDGCYDRSLWTVSQRLKYKILI
jgi:hypothetical protein